MGPNSVRHRSDQKVENRHGLKGTPVSLVRLSWEPKGDQDGSPRIEEKRDPYTDVSISDEDLRDFGLHRGTHKS